MLKVGGEEWEGHKEGFQMLLEMALEKQLDDVFKNRGRWECSCGDCERHA